MSAREVIADWLSDAAIQNGFENSRGKSINDHADTILSALDKAGYAVVPKEPTLGMNEAGYMAKYAGFWAPDIYKAMVQAAKETP